MENSNIIQFSGYSDEELVSLAVAAKLMNMSTSFVKSLKYCNKIQYYQMGRCTRIKVADLKQYIDKCRVEGGNEESADV